MSKHSYRAYGMNITSDWPLPSLAAATFDEADLDIRHDEIAPYLGSDWQEQAKAFKNWEAMPGAFLMKVHGVADYLAKDGNTILIERADAAGDDAVTAYMMGSVMAAILQQRKITLLHASSVQVEGGAILFVGRSGAGKSTLATKLMTLGHSLITDDVAAVETDDNGTLCVTPAFPTARLWGDALEHLSFEEKVKQRVRPEMEKFLVTADGFCDAQQPIKAIYILQTHNLPDVKIDAVAKLDAHHKLNNQGFRNGFLKGHKAFPNHFETMMQLANNIPLFEVNRPREGFELDALSTAIIEHSGGLTLD